MQKQNSLTFHWLFPDQIQFFRDKNTAVLQPICLLAAFTSSLKCTSLILQMKQIKSLNSLLAQNIQKLTSFHSLSERSEREKKSTLFSHFKKSKYLLQYIFWAKIMKFPDFSLTWYLKFPWPVLQNSLTFPTLKKNQISLTLPDQWPPWFKDITNWSMTKQTKWLVCQRRLRTVWTTAQSDQSSLSAVLGYPYSIQQAMIRLGGCAGWPVLAGHMSSWRFCGALTLITLSNMLGSFMILPKSWYDIVERIHRCCCQDACLSHPTAQCFTHSHCPEQSKPIKDRFFQKKYMWATTWQNVSLGVSDRARHKPACAATEPS